MARTSEGWDRGRVRRQVKCRLREQQGASGGRTDLAASVQVLVAGPGVQACVNCLYTDRFDKLKIRCNYFLWLRE